MAGSPRFVIRCGPRVPAADPVLEQGDQSPRQVQGETRKRHHERPLQELEHRLPPSALVADGDLPAQRGAYRGHPSLPRPVVTREMLTDPFIIFLGGRWVRRGTHDVVASVAGLRSATIRPVSSPAAYWQRWHPGSPPGRVPYVIRGRGRSRLPAGDLPWEEGDFFALPAGSRAEHHAETDAAFYWIHDEPLLRYLGAKAGEERFKPTLYPRQRALAMLAEVERTRRRPSGAASASSWPTGTSTRPGPSPT
jgi:hypothetical protein